MYRQRGIPNVSLQLSEEIEILIKALSQRTR